MPRPPGRRTSTQSAHPRAATAAASTHAPCCGATTDSNAACTAPDSGGLAGPSGAGGVASSRGASCRSSRSSRSASCFTPSGAPPSGAGWGWSSCSAFFLLLSIQRRLRSLMGHDQAASSCLAVMPYLRHKVRAMPSSLMPSGREGGIAAGGLARNTGEYRERPRTEGNTGECGPANRFAVSDVKGSSGPSAMTETPPS